MKIFEMKDMDFLFERIREKDIKGPDVQYIIDDIIDRGDEALYEYTEEFEGRKPKYLRVPKEILEESLADIIEEKPELYDALLLAKERIEKYHKNQSKASFSISNDKSFVMQRVTAIDRVGIYIPGGTAAYPSTLLMNGIPAQIAGVKEIVVVSPQAENGLPHKVIMATAALLGLDEFYTIGGAQSIGALAYGTESIKAVDKITGPGNRYVASAKRAVFGKVDIDMIAGPSELTILGDENSNPEFIAADLLSQAEHDELATVILITDSKKLADDVNAEIKSQLEELERKEIAIKAIENKASIIMVKDMAEGIDAINMIAPEHLSIQTKKPELLLTDVVHAGSVFIGDYSPEALGDYLAGPNHTLPTSGTARFSSPLAVYDFQKRMSVIHYTKEGLEEVADGVLALAKEEGLEAHGKAVEIRSKNE